VTAALGADVAGWLSRTLVAGSVEGVSAPTAEPQREPAEDHAPASRKAD
jgi:hypothetical protein